MSSTPKAEFAVVLGEEVEDAFGHFVAAAADADECERFAVGAERGWRWRGVRRLRRCLRR
jgi:hypothetical protein